MRKGALIPVALPLRLLVLSARAHETVKAAQATASANAHPRPGLEMESLVLSEGFRRMGCALFYELQKTNWEENAFRTKLVVADIATGESHALTSAKKIQHQRGVVAGRKMHRVFFPTGLDKSRDADVNKQLRCDILRIAAKPATHQC